MARVKEIWRYPVKSMAGERLTETAVGERGVWGDRAWAIRDEEGAAICGAKKIGALMKLNAVYADAPTSEGSSRATIKFEDGLTAYSTDPDIHERLSSALGRKVTLWPLVAPENQEHYKREIALSNLTDAELRTMFARAADEPLPDFETIPPELIEFESPVGTYFDAFPLLIMTTRSLDSLQQRALGSRFDVRRFRPNFLVDGVESTDPFPELGWVGRRARIGGVVVELVMGCPRCVMITREFQDLDKDPNVMRVVVRESKGEAGVGAVVVEAGTVREGDAFELLD